MPEPDLPATYGRLREILAAYLDEVHVKTDEPGSVYLERLGTPRPELFSAVAIKKAYVSFHYMPVYADPSLVDGLPEGLRRRMQGKSCFNFTRPDDPAIADLERLVEDTARDFLA